MEGESEDVRDLYITVFIVRNAIRIVWGEGRPLLMSSHEQRTHEEHMSIKIMRHGMVVRHPPCSFVHNNLVSLVCPPWGNVYTLSPLGKVFHCMGGALGVVMITAGACGGWTSVGTELQGEQRDLA